jgi:hypothetical protein
MTLQRLPRSGAVFSALAVVAFLGTPALARDNQKGKIDPALACVAAKQRAAGKYCADALRALGRFEQTGNTTRRDAAIATAAGKLEAAWTDAEATSTGAGTDCAAAFLTASAAETAIDSAGGALVGEVNTGLDVTARAQAKCGARILRAAAAKCQALLQAEGLYQHSRRKPTATDKRAKQIANAGQTFTKAFGKATGGTCPTAATATSVEADVDAISARIVRDTLASPEAGDGDYVGIQAGPTDYLGRTFTPTCLNGTPYEFWARRGTVNKLVVYYQGGGACWEQLTCSLPTCDVSVDAGDNPGLFDAGFGDLSNPSNPFKDWSAVFVSYCTCDIHFGDAAQDYTNVDPAHPKHVEHRGYENARVVEKWARDHFLAPEEVFVTGSSAGAYGAWFNAPLHELVWPSAHFNVLADAGNGVVTQNFLQTYFPNWNFEANLPADIPELKQVLDDGQGIPGYTEVIAGHFPNTNWAHYATAFDGGSGGQTGFYNLMLNNNDVLHAVTWWEGSCAFNSVMRSQAIATAAAIDGTTKNYRYYIGSGSRHTMWGSDKVYGDTTGGVPTLVDWVNAMLASEPGSPAGGWTNVEANPENVLLPGDPRPSPLVAPFVMSGSDVVVDCPSGP